MRIPALDPLRAEVDLAGAMGFVVAIGPGEAGGEIVLYPGVRWEEGVRASFPATAALVAGDEPPRHAVRLRAGQGLVFPAGRVYHRVAPVYGRVPRWTIGTFCAPTLNGSAFRYWA